MWGSLPKNPEEGVQGPPLETLGRGRCAKESKPLCECVHWGCQPIPACLALPTHSHPGAHPGATATVWPRLCSSEAPVPVPSPEQRLIAHQLSRGLPLTPLRPAHLCPEWVW